MSTVAFEFVVPGPPFSVNIARKQTRKHREWKEKVGAAARTQWRADARTESIPTDKPVAVVITTYYTNLALDVDNVIKPILDALKGALYDNDAQVYRVTSERIALKSETIGSVSSALLNVALSNYKEIVHITLEWKEEE